MTTRKKSFFERLTGSIRMDDDAIESLSDDEKGHVAYNTREWSGSTPELMEEEEGELAVDVYDNGESIVIQAMTAGVRKSDLDVTISREMVIIRGERTNDADPRNVTYLHQELYWGRFSRTVQLPDEIEVEEAAAKEEHGLLTIILPKINKNKQTKLKVI